ncbi:MULTISPECIES: hypothetical protein [Bacillaceae]|uniref:Branched-chain amino acid aminotransferase n=1 Tax=Peribacillus huizhouensis TaxID=1501239 RepID=A0ABR6CQ14_9BACI|nr:MULTISPECIES: hypothetical protein [Bacillaceae]MBA9027115.1 hypothetical protein [Peribacillus huizhouensis]
MIKTKLKQYITDELSKGATNKIELYKEEKEYAETNQLIDPQIIIIEEKNEALRFADIYIERSDKETEELISEENSAFLDQSIIFLKTNRNEFMYVEADSFDIIGVEAVSLELDDVFGTYDVMLGLKQQKKTGPVIKELLAKQLGESASFNLLFNQGEGMWDLNFSLNDLAGFKEELSIREVLQLIYRFLFTLVEEVEIAK